MRPKFANPTDTEHSSPVAHVWQPVYETIQRANGNSILATVVGSGIDLILKLTEDYPGPYEILYVLVVPRKTRPGRYQLAEQMDRNGLITYLERYRAYFEGDGRHHIWVKCGDHSLIVYDRHETLSLYGNLDGFYVALENLGYGSGEVRVDFTHDHHYNAEFDGDELSIVQSDEYLFFDLVPDQDC